MQRTLSAALAAAALVLVTGCGGDGDDVTTTPAEDPTASADPTQTATPSESAPPPLPACTSVWPSGTTLPEDYAGCRENGERVVRSVRCESGQQLFTYAGRYFAVPGGPIFSADGALADDLQFQKMKRVCTA